MNQQSKLKLQAYLDRELSAAEAQETAEWLERDPQAQALYAEFKALDACLKEAELPVKLPESREFYWSKIERALGQPEASLASDRAGSHPSWWFRFIAPAAGVALVFFGVLAVVRMNTAPSAMSYLHEIETPLDNTSTISFHSQSPAMTIVWVQNQPN